VYVGETTKLYSRWSQHVKGTGSQCTRQFEPINILGLYNISKNIAFENYRNDNNMRKLLKTFDMQWQDMYANEKTNLDVENYITECIMKNKCEDWWTVRGGKYTKLITDKILDFDCTLCDNHTCDDCVLYTQKNEEMIELGFIQRMLKVKDCTKPILNVDRPNCLCGYPAEINMYNNELYYTCPLKNANNWVDFEGLGLYENCKFFEKYKSNKPESKRHSLTECQID
jgi:predicted GIY-YIG superfamily endonuclease